MADTIAHAVLELLLGTPRDAALIVERVNGRMVSVELRAPGEMHVAHVECAEHGTVQASHHHELPAKDPP